MAKAFALALIGALAMAVLATTAIGRSSVDSDVSITNPAAGTYKGKVTSDARKCEKRRHITVYHDDDDNGIDGDDFVIGTAVSSRTGKWSMSGEEQAPHEDTVIAHAEKKKRRSTLCKEAEGSTTVP